MQKCKIRREKMKGGDLVKGGWDLQKERDKGMAD